MKTQTWTRWALVGAMAVLLSGCNGGSDSGLFSAITSFFTGSSDETFSDASGEHLASVSLAEQAATVHNPEPSSLILFGAGLAGARALRRRRKNSRA